mgnify:FL=1
MGESSQYLNIQKIRQNAAIANLLKVYAYVAMEIEIGKMPVAYNKAANLIMDILLLL